MTKVDRHYSQFEEIRLYQDRGMMKWQGFFLSEHTSEIKKIRHHRLTMLIRSLGSWSK